MAKEIIGGLEVNVVDNLSNFPGKKPEAIVLLLHGYGANAADLTPLAEAALRGSPRPVRIT